MTDNQLRTNQNNHKFQNNNIKYSTINIIKIKIFHNQTTTKPYTQHNYKFQDVLKRTTTLYGFR